MLLPVSNYNSFSVVVSEISVYQAPQAWITGLENMTLKSHWPFCRQIRNSNVGIFYGLFILLSKDASFSR